MRVTSNLNSSGAVLRMALRLQLQSRDEKLATDAQGEFLIPNLAPGDYKVEISYIGFTNLEIPVTVKAGETARVDAKLAVSLSQQVIVTAERPRAGRRIHQPHSRGNDNLLQVLPAEVITSLPNANVADALGRLPSITLERIEGEGVYVIVRGTEARAAD